MRAVLDPNVLIAALLSPAGAPAKALTAWIHGAYELVVSPLLLEELERALGYRRLRQRITNEETRDLIQLLRHSADLHEDPSGDPPVRSPDPGDDYLIALAAAANAVIVSGDRHLLGLDQDLPVYSPAAFLEVIDDRDR